MGNGTAVSLEGEGIKLHPKTPIALPVLLGYVAVLTVGLLLLALYASKNPAFMVLLGSRLPLLLMGLAICIFLIGAGAFLFLRLPGEANAHECVDLALQREAHRLERHDQSQSSADCATAPSPQIAVSGDEVLASNRVLAWELKRLFGLLDLPNEGLVALDNSQRIIFANKASAPFLKVPPAEAHGQPAQDCISQPEVLYFLSAEGTEEASRGIRSIELPPDQASGRDHVAVFFCRSFSTDELLGHILLFRDIGHIKSVERLQSEFVDNVAHELRTPLTSIRASVEMLIDGEATDTQAKYDFYNIIYEETDRLSNLIDNLLNISMMESGCAKLSITPTRVKRLLEDALEVVRPQSDKKRINLTAHLPDRLPSLNIDKKLFSVAVINILGNAVKYTPDGGSVMLETESYEEEFHVTVRDTGVGISEENLSRIFEKFYRCSSSMEVQGSGVGLATAMQVVRLHGGDIRVSSKIGEGSLFSIVMPRSIINTTIGE